MKLCTRRARALVAGLPHTRSDVRHYRPEAAESAPARAYVQPEPVTATSGMAMTDALALLEARGEPRLVVLGDDGETLAGLLCANADGTGFCVRP